MRTLNKNKIEVWLVSPSSYTELKDENGDYTGEFTTTYTTPEEIRLSLYPSTSEVLEEIFGLNHKLDMLVVSDIVLSEDDLLFLSEPAVGADYATTFDYMVKKIMPSLNSYQYGLRKRING